MIRRLGVLHALCFPAAGLASAFTAGCAESNAEQKKAEAAEAQKKAEAAPKEADRGRCDTKDKRVVEIDVNKDGRPDIACIDSTRLKWYENSPPR